VRMGEAQMGSQGAKIPSRTIPGDLDRDDQKPFKLKFVFAAILLLSINLGIGLLARQQQHKVIDYAIDIYDTSFTSTNYLHHAQISFQRFVDERTAAETPAQILRSKEQLPNIIDLLEVSIDRANSSKWRDDARVVQARIKSIIDRDDRGPLLIPHLADLEDALEQLGRRSSNVVLKARDDIEDFSSDGDLLLLASILTSVILAAITLILLRRAFAKSAHARENYLARMTQLAKYDSLTGLPNRNLLYARLKQLLSDESDKTGIFAVLSLDLDRFKNVNDSLGHWVGDLLLQEVARRIEGLLPTDCIAARFGGDEFVVLSTILANPVEAGLLAERLIETIGAPYHINQQRIDIGASVGIAISPENGEDADDLLRNSDLALYRAKVEGRATARYFAAEMNAAVQSRRLMEIDLREALANDRLEVFYQPLISISTGQVCSCEALVRWNHPTRGYISPAEFVPLAEETGLIGELGEFVLNVACKEAASWPRNLGISVNLSVVQFRSCDLVSLVNSVLLATDLEPSRLELEITESVLMDEKETARQTLEALRELGVQISLDDFGTGYSSLAYLSSFPFDKIKIDRSFVRDVRNRPDSAAIISAILDLAANLGMSTTAEGVETVEDLDWLHAQGCNTAQGFLFSEAVSARDLKPLLGMKQDRDHGKAARARAG